MKILNGILPLSLGLLLGLCVFTVPSVATNDNTNVAIQAPAEDADLSNPFCGQLTPPCPFFDPCPEGGHVNRECADTCCREYQAKVRMAYDIACITYGIKLDEYMAKRETISDEFSDCLSSGTSPWLCISLRNASIKLLNEDLAITKESVKCILGGKLDKALEEYFDCLLACDCIEDPPTPQ